MLWLLKKSDGIWIGGNQAFINHTTLKIMTTFNNEYNALLDQGPTIEELSRWTTTFHAKNNRLLFSCNHVSKELGGGVTINSKK